MFAILTGMAMVADRAKPRMFFARMSRNASQNE